MHLRRSRSAALAPLAALLLVLGGCSGDSPADDTTTAAGEKDDKGGAASETPSEEPSEEPTDDAGGASEGAACIVGDWSGDVDEQMASMKEIMEQSGLEATVEFSGEVVSSFGADGQATSTYGNQVMDITMAAEGQEIRTVTTMNGVTKGTYTATDTDITMTVTDVSGLEYAMEMYMGGEKIDTGTEGSTDELLEAMKTSTTVSYTCSGDTLIMSTPNPALGGAPVDSVLHRR